MTSQQPTSGEWASGPPSAQPLHPDWRTYSAPVPVAPLIEQLPAGAATRVLAVALVAGVAAQYLFVGQRPGINVPLWTALVLVAVWALRPSEAGIHRTDLWLPFAALSFAGFVALRDETALRAFDLPVTGALTLASAVALAGVSVTRRGLISLCILGATALGLAMAGGIGLGSGLRPIGERVARGSAVVRVLRGLLVAVPLLVVFLLLFSAADSVFAAHLEAAFRLDLDTRELFFRLLFAGAAGWLMAGTVVVGWQLRAVGGGAEGEVAAMERRPLGWLEGLVVVLALDVLFVLFVIVQATYLFGGADTLEVSGMTYADYARRGFFELLAVGFLAGAVLLGIDRLIDSRGWGYRAASGALAVLTGIVLTSAVVRLGLYQQAYGWTELRFFALAAICWVGLGILATAAALLADRAAVVPRLLAGLGLTVAVGVNLLGPQGFVASQNLQRVIDPTLVPPDGRSGVDFHYLDSLGYDAVPAVVAALPRLTGGPRTNAERFLSRRAAALAREAPELGWPSWNLARHHAIEALVTSGFLVRHGP